MRIGVQLYTLRRQLRTADQFDAVFARVAQMGAECVQLSGIGPFDADFMKALTERHHLPVCATHSPYARIAEDLDRLAEEHLTYGCRTIGIGRMPGAFDHKRLAGIQRFCDFLNDTGRKLAQYDLRIAYHNHAFEFKVVEGQRIYDYMIAHTDSAVQFIPDTFWIKVGGFAPETYINKLAGRASVMHLKDYKKGLLPMIKPVGDGAFDFAAILKAAEASGITDAVVELDFARRPYEALESSLRHLDKVRP